VAWTLREIVLKPAPLGIITGLLAAIAIAAAQRSPSVTPLGFVPLIITAGRVITASSRRHAE
jgi:hypothetical protein